MSKAIETFSSAQARRTDAVAGGRLLSDVFAGFVVFLIAVPLSLGIARASGYPLTAGLWAAIIGGLVGSRLSNSRYAIKGPAAGLIVLMSAAVRDLGHEFASELTPGEQLIAGCRLTSAIVIAAGVLQVVAGYLRGGRLTEFFPLTPIHGVLSGIGIIIIVRQAYELLGVPVSLEAAPVQQLASLPDAFRQMNPQVAAIGLVTLILVLVLPRFPIQVTRQVPIHLIALAVAMMMSVALNLSSSQMLQFPSPAAAGSMAGDQQGSSLIPSMMSDLQYCFAGMLCPDFRSLLHPAGFKYVFLMAVIASLETLLSARAVELLDKDGRRTNFDRELMAVGVSNVLSGMIGGLPVISTVVRSRANIDAGARSSWSGFFHGLFLLMFVLCFPWLLQRIPVAALAAMLIAVGFHLASPREFDRRHRMGREEKIVFGGAMLATVFVDLLVGLGVGIVLKVLLLLRRGAPASVMFRPQMEIIPGDRQDSVIVIVRQACVFSNWPLVQAAILQEFQIGDDVTVDLTNSQFVDRSVEQNLEALTAEFEAQGKRLSVLLPALPASPVA
ncbi:MAG: SulP family inorganic anion transporter [Planctomycetaceae bacterium]